MVWGAVAGAAGGAAGGLLGGLTSARATARQNRRHREFYQKTLTHGPMWRMEGLQRAGLNPILAAQGALTAGGAAPGGTGGGGGTANIMEGARTGALLKHQATLAASTAKRALWDQKTAYQASQASEFLPLKAKTEWDTMLANQRLTSAKAALAEAELPRARTKERLLGDLEKEFIGTYHSAGGLSAMRDRIWRPQTEALSRFQKWLGESEPGYKKIQRWTRSRKKKANK